MELVFFLETDSAFTLAYRAYGELSPRLNPMGTQTAELDPVLSRNGKTNFSNGFNFARRVSVASRILMCVTTRLQLVEWADNQVNITPDVQLQDGGVAFSLNVQHLPLHYFVARFDQMFPHYLIQEKLHNQNNFPLTRKMLIFRLENNIVVDIIEMITTINIDEVNNLGDMKCSIITTAINSLLNEGEDGVWYKHLQSICFQPIQDVHLPCVEEREEHPEDDDDSDSDDSILREIEDLKL